MGTRSLTIFQDFETKQETCVLYRQYDGYPSGYGRDLAEILQRFKMVNGLNGADYDNPESYAANGLPCLAARVIALFKKAPGLFYLYPAGARDMNEEFIYFVRVSDSDIFVTVTDDKANELFTGTVRKFAEWTKEQE
jgi:hypothetical protein